MTQERIDHIYENWDDLVWTTKSINKFRKELKETDPKEYNKKTQNRLKELRKKAEKEANIVEPDKISNIKGNKKTKEKHKKPSNFVLYLFILILIAITTASFLTENYLICIKKDHDDFWNSKVEINATLYFERNQLTSIKLDIIHSFEEKEDFNHMKNIVENFGDKELNMLGIYNNIEFNNNRETATISITQDKTNIAEEFLSTENRDRSSVKDELIHNNYTCRNNTLGNEIITFFRNLFNR